MADPRPEENSSQLVAGDARAEPHGAEGSSASIHIALVPPCRLVVQATAGARVIGKRGESIKAIRAASGASVKVLQDELPETFRRRKECIVLASCGEAASLRVAISGILDRVFDRSGLPDPLERSRERPYVVDIVVPARANGPLVGPSGERIKALIEELGCDITVVREPLAGIAAQKRVRVLSREREKADSGVWRLQEVLAEFVQAGTLKPEEFDLREALATQEDQSNRSAAGEEVPLRMLLAHHDAATIVGRMGANVRRLRDIAHVSIDDAEAPFDPSDRVCFVARAPLGDRIRVLRFVLSDLCMRRELNDGQCERLAEGSRPVCLRLLLPADRWEELSELLSDVSADSHHGPLPCRLFRETGTKVYVHERGWTDSGVPALLRVLQLEGIEEEVASAVWRVHRVLEPWEPTDIPPRWTPNLRNTSESAEEDNSTGKGAGKSNSAAFKVVGGLLEPGRRPLTQSARTGDASWTSLQSADAVSTSAPSRVETETQHRACPQDIIGGRVSVSQHSAPALTSLSSLELHPEKVPDLVLTDKSMVSTFTARTSPTSMFPQADIEASNCPTPAKGVNATGEGLSSLLVVVPSDLCAIFLASEASGIAKRAGVKLDALPTGFRGASAPVLKITGTTAASAWAAYLVQAHLWLSSVLGT